MDWLQKNYTLDVNPGFEAAKDPSAAYQGLFYYFHTMARALDLYGTDAIVDSEAPVARLARELCGRLVAMQSKIDGSWVNANAAAMVRREPRARHGLRRHDPGRRAALKPGPARVRPSLARGGRYTPVA